MRGAICTLELVGFLDRAVISGSTHKPTPDGLHRKPVLFMFGSDYGPLFGAANKRAAAARERRLGSRRPSGLPAREQRSAAALSARFTNSPKSSLLTRPKAKEAKRLR